MKLPYIRCKSGAPQYHPENKEDYKYWDNPIHSFIGIDNVKDILGDLPQKIIAVFYDGTGELTGVDRFLEKGV